MNNSNDTILHFHYKLLQADPDLKQATVSCPTLEGRLHSCNCCCADNIAFVGANYESSPLGEVFENNVHDWHYHYYYSYTRGASRHIYAP